MAETARNLESEALEVVMLGSFNPAILHPQWFLRQKLIGEEEALAAKIKVVAAEVAGRAVDRRVGVPEPVAPVAPVRGRTERVDVAPGHDEAVDAITPGDEEHARVVLARDGAVEIDLVGQRELPPPSRLHHVDPRAGREGLEPVDHEIGVPLPAERKGGYHRVVARAQIGERGAVEHELLDVADAGHRRAAAARMREQQIIQALHEGRTTVAAITESVYDGLDLAFLAAATENVRAHLEKLKTEGRAFCETEHWRI